MTTDDADALRLQQELQAIVEQHGAWTAGDLPLPHGLWTGKDRTCPQTALRRIVQAIDDLADRPFRDLRILDLGSLEGHFALEFARRGARVVAVEGREANIEKARFVRRALALPDVEFILGDVRTLDPGALGSFDVVVCSGILYHLDAPDLVPFLERVTRMCRRLAVIDTHISLAPEIPLVHGGTTYWGCAFTEHAPGATPEEKRGKRWASLDNPKSFWLTRPSLLNLLADLGYSSAHECLHPPVLNRRDRVTLAAVKGTPQELPLSPATNLLKERWPEDAFQNAVEYERARRLARLEAHPYVRFGLFLNRLARKLTGRG